MISACHAGFVLPGLREALAASGLIGTEAMHILWRSICTAECDSTLDFSGRKQLEDPVLFTAANLISRGLPTYPSVSLETIFTESFHRSSLDSDDRGRLRSTWLSPDTEFLTPLLRALRAAAPPSDAQPADRSAADAGALLSSVEGREALQLALSPIGAARVQKILLQALIAGGLDLGAPSWSIVIVERDVPCGALGIAEFRRLLGLLFTLEGKGRRVPEISATIRPHTAFVDSPLHAQPGVRLAGKGALIPPAAILIDIGILHRRMSALPELPAEIKHRVTLRGAGKEAEPRRFHLTEIQPWKPLSVKGTEGFDPQILEAVSSLLADCFRIGRPTDEQLRLIDLVLQNRSCLAALPPVTGKSLVYQFAALLQPALSFVVEPLASLAADQCDQLADVCIDCAVCPHEGLGTEERAALYERVRGRGALILLVTAELFRSGEMDELLGQLRQDKVCFAQCVIDEAQCMSEWSHDPRPAMQRAPAFAVPRMQAGKNNVVAVRLLTASLARDVLADLRWQLAGLGRSWMLEDAQCVVGTGMLMPQQHFRVVGVPVSASDPAATLARRQAVAVEALRGSAVRFAALNEQVEPSLRMPENGAPAELPTVLYCPYSSGALGVTNHYAAGVSEPAVDETLRRSGINFGVFIGKDDSRSRVGRHGIIDAIAQRGLFRRGERDLLIATRAYGIGSHKPDIRCTLHLLPPPGVERLVQECARGGHDGRLSLHTILYGASEPGGESDDLQLGIDLLEAGAGDAAREKQLVHDLLREISYPEDSNASRVAGMIAEEFGIDARVSYWQRGLDERMYVQHGRDVFGYLDLLTQEIVPDPKYAGDDAARDILSFAATASLAAAGSGQSLSSWVATIFPADIDDGIARQIADFDPGADFILHVGYENDREPLLNQIHQLLWRQAEIEIQRKILSEIPGNNWREFRAQLIRRIGRPDLFATLDPDIEERLVQLFNKIRTRSDTERVLFRLATLGALRDYTSHPLTRKFSLHMTVRSDEEYRSALEEYLGLFLTVPQVERSLYSLRSCPGDTMLERCLYFLIDFAYARCHGRRLASARMMDALCQSALQQGDDAFREQIGTSLAAKYALPDRLPAAIQRTTDRLGLLADCMQLIEEDGSASVRENASQLAASAALLEKTYPAEPSIPLLHSFAELVNARDDGAWSAARTAFVRAFAESAAASGLEGAQCIAALGGFETRLRRYFNDDAAAQLFTALGEEAGNVRALPLPPAVSVEMLSAREKAARKQAERKQAERKQAELKQAELKQAERKEAERREAERREAERKEAERKEAERKEAERKEAERKEAERKAAERKGTGRKIAEDAQKGVSDAARMHGAPDELDLILADLETSLSESRAAGTAAAVSTGEETGPVTAGADPSFIVHLDWLRMFNNRFLKHYES